MAKAKSKGRLVGTLFALPFAGVGTFIGGWAVSDVLTTRDMRDWVRVDATLTSAGVNYHTGDDSTTYEAYASYYYDYEGRRYEGDRVAVSSGSDNIGSFQQQTGQRLKRLFDSGETVAVYVDPDAPGQSIIDRSVRWGLTLFKTLFGLVFAAVGYGLLYGLYFHKSPQPSRSAPSAIPWQDRPEWNPSGILSNARLGARFALGFAAFWNLVSWPVLIAALPDILAEKNYVALVVVLFPIIGMFLIFWAVKQRRDWRKFNKVPLVLDPFPGSIGGDVGGTFALKAPYDQQAQFDVTVSAFRVSRDSEGDRKETVLWQDSMPAAIRQSADGMQLAFRMPVPHDQQESSLDEDSGIHWRVNLRGESAEGAIDRDYSIPVFATVESSDALNEDEIEQVDRTSADRAERAVRQLAEFTFDHNGQQVFFPAGRSLEVAAGLGIGGAIFGVAGTALAWTGEGVILGGIFAFIGLVLLLLGLYLGGNSLQIKKRSGELQSVRRVLGLPVKRRTLPTASVSKLVTETGMSSSSGTRHTVYYNLNIVDRDGNKIRLGEGFKGQDEVRVARRLLVEALGLPRRLIDEESA